MRKFRVLNKNYEDIGLFTPISALNGYSLYDVYYLEVAVPFLSSEQYDYWEDVYNNIKNGIIEPNLKYKDFGKSIQDVALVNKWTKKNLASPDLEGKEYLGDGVYRLYNYSGITIDYNVYNGIYTLNGTASSSNHRYNINSIDIKETNTYTLSYQYISGSVTSRSTGVYLMAGSDAFSPRATFDYDDIIHTSIVDKGLYNIRFAITSNNITYTNYQFKLQLEKGDTATEYELPYIEGYSKTTFRYSDLFDGEVNVKGNNKNLAIPNLEGKEYLGDGEYRLYNSNGITIDYNVYSGINEINGTTTATFIETYLPYIFDNSYNPMIMSFHPISGTRSIGYAGVYNYSYTGLPDSINNIVFPLNNNVSSIIVGNPNNSNWGGKRDLHLYIDSNVTFNNYKFKLQLEKGDTATEYTVPASTDMYASVKESYNMPEMEFWTNVDALVPQPSISQLNAMFRYYIKYRFDRALPSVYLPIEPVGFGNRYKFKELNNKTYDHELDFENMELSMLFGVYSNAYTSYKAMQEFVKNNELVIEYDYGIGKRYTDVRLINAPKTEKETNKLIISRFSFKRLTPFYELLDESDLPITNDTGLDMGIILKYNNYNENSVWFNFKIDGVISRVYLHNPQSLNFELYDSLGKKMIFNGENVGYGMINWSSTDEPFIVLKPNQVLEVFDEGDGIIDKVIIKKWVVD